ncbi:MAG: isochorismatase family protein [Nanoarchaeota archaeon]
MKARRAALLLGIIAALSIGEGCATKQETMSPCLEQRISYSDPQFQERMIDMDSLAIILMDMQEPFLYYTKDSKTVIQNQLETLDYAKKNNIPVIMIEYEGNGPTVRPLREKLAELSNVYRITKSKDNAFHDTKLEQQLKQQGIQTLYFMGGKFPYCLFRTANYALKKGFNIISSEDVIFGNVMDECNYATANWFSHYGIYKENHQQLLPMIMTSNISQ